MTRERQVNGSGNLSSRTMQPLPPDLATASADWTGESKEYRCRCSPGLARGALRPYIRSKSR
eukprot:7849019-Pyramimonas_sp.AAC.1